MNTERNGPPRGLMNSDRLNCTDLEYCLSNKLVGKRPLETRIILWNMYSIRWSDTTSLHSFSMHATRSSGSLHISFEINPVHSFISSNCRLVHVSSDFPSHLHRKAVVCQGSFPLTIMLKPSDLPLLTISSSMHILPSVHCHSPAYLLVGHTSCKALATVF